MNCPACGGEAKLNISFYEVPYFGRVLLNSITCSCGFKHSDVFIAENKEPTRFKIRINERTLFSKVIRSTSGTIRIPELGLAMEPGPASQAFITNVEGVLVRFEEVVEMAKKWNRGEKAKRCEWILKKLRMAKEGKEELTLIIEDPFGNSMIIDDEVFMERIENDEALKLKTGTAITLDLNDI